MVKPFDVKTDDLEAVRRTPMLNTLAQKGPCANTPRYYLWTCRTISAPKAVPMHRKGRDLSLVQAMVPRLANFLSMLLGRPVLNAFGSATSTILGPDWYLSEVWLEQAERRRNGALCESIWSAKPEAWNGDFYQVRPRPDEAIVIKHRFGAFESTDLDLVLRSQGIRTVIMTGIATNVCVETTARQAFLRDYYVVFTSDCTATYSQRAHDATLENIDHFFGQVVASEEIMACWQPAAARLRAVT